ncbi:MAG: preprotein translocase subunit SecE [Dehalococcoidia bacterium]|nr:preprotein translocase subunit SecE [Dehalococcoidia bacterium]
MTSQGATAKNGSPRFKFIGETIAELKKVVWLSRREVVYLTSLVLIVVVIVGAFLGVVDFGFAKLIDGLFLGR